jgi:glycosyltransferase involved in cell wall biosynthesis
MAAEHSTDAQSPGESRSPPAVRAGGRPRRVLLVENTVRGLGGSYESLFLTAKGLDRRRFEPVALFFQENHFSAKLGALGIQVVVERSRRFWEREGYIRRTGAVRSILPRRGFLGAARRRAVAFVRGIVGGLPMARTVASVIRRERIDLLHTNNNLERDAMVILGGVLAGVPIVAHERQLVPCSATTRWLSGRVHTLICISDAVLEFTRTSGARPRARRRIHNAIDLDAVRGVRPSLPPGPPRVGLAGRIMPKKGQRHFIEAARIVRDAVPDAEFYIIGRATEEDRAYEEECRALAGRLGLDGALHWTGYLEEPLGLMASLDACVHAAIEPEPFGRVVIEALALGVPVVATALGGPVEIIEDGVSGFLVPPGDAASIAAKVIDLLRDHGLADRVRRGGRDRVERAFSIEAYIAEIERVYAEALTGAPGGAGADATGSPSPAREEALP